MGMNNTEEELKKVLQQNIALAEELKKRLPSLVGIKFMMIFLGVLSIIMLMVVLGWI